MKHKVFSIFDSVAQCYLPPFCLHETAMAVRSFSDCINSPEHQFGKHPGDYTLFELGSFDDAVCVVACSPSAMKIANGLELFVVDLSADSTQKVVDFKVVEADGEDTHETT